MPGSIKKISIIYDANNQENTFFCGDFISGRLILEIGKETKIDYLLIKAKGKARALWTEHYGQVTVVYCEKEKYFTLENYIIQEKKGDVLESSNPCQGKLTAIKQGAISAIIRTYSVGQDEQALLSGSGETYSNILTPGIHAYPFTFQIPERNMPSSFKGSAGKIVYTLEAKLGRPMRVPSKTKTKFTFLSKSDPDIPQLREPQYGMKEEKMKVFTSGDVAMTIKTERMGYVKGEGLKVIAEIKNSSSRSIVPKFLLYQKQSFFARGKRRVHTKDILKECGESLPASTSRTVTKVLGIPDTISTTILNCKVVNVEYRLKVYLDISFAKDPAIKVPVVILPADSPFGNMVREPPPSYSDIFSPTKA